MLVLDQHLALITDIVLVSPEALVNLNTSVSTTVTVSSVTTSVTASGNTSTEGSSASNTNLPPYYALCYIIKHTLNTLPAGPPGPPGPAGTSGGSTGNGSWTVSVGTHEVIDTLGIGNVAVEYLLHFSNTLGKQIQKVAILNNGTTAYSQDFAVTYDNHPLVSVGASVFGGSLTLHAIPETGVSGTIDYKYFRTELS